MCWGAGLTRRGTLLSQQHPNPGHSRPAGEFPPLPSPRRPRRQRARQVWAAPAAGVPAVGCTPGLGGCGAGRRRLRCPLTPRLCCWPGAQGGILAPAATPPGRRDAPASDDRSRGYFYNRAGRFPSCFFFFFLFFPLIANSKGTKEGRERQELRAKSPPCQGAVSVLALPPSPVQPVSSSGVRLVLTALALAFPGSY